MNNVLSCAVDGGDANDSGCGMGAHRNRRQRNHHLRKKCDGSLVY
jgi:hypothetical protein